MAVRGTGQLPFGLPYGISLFLFRILTIIPTIAMPDVQNFFHKALAVIFAKVQYQKKAFCELYRVIPFSSCACNVCGSYARFNFQYKRAPLVLHRFVRHKYLREDSQWDKLWYNFPVVAQSHSGERAVFFFFFFLKVNLTESLPTNWTTET